MKEKRKTIGTGILQPALENRFRVSIDVSDPDQHQRLMMQATSVVANYAKKEVTLTFEQDAITTDLHEYFFSVGGKIKRWDAPKCHVLVEVLAGDGEPTSGVKYVGKLIDHKYELNYANSGAAKHIVVIGIKEMIPYESEHMKKIA